MDELFGLVRLAVSEMLCKGDALFRRRDFFIYFLGLLCWIEQALVRSRGYKAVAVAVFDVFGVCFVFFVLSDVRLLSLLRTSCALHELEGGGGGFDGWLRQKARYIDGSSCDSPRCFGLLGGCLERLPAAQRVS